MNEELRLLDASGPLPLYFDPIKERSCYVSKWGRRYFFHDRAHPAVRQTALLQAQSGRSIPKHTFSSIDAHGVLILRGRYGDEEAVYPETPDAFAAAVKRLHQINDTKEGLQ